MYPDLPLRKSVVAKALFWMGLALIGVFSANVIAAMLPLALLLPAWQARVGNVILANAHLAGIGAILILLAQQLDDDSEDLEKWVRRLYLLSIPAAIGFFLLIPLQTYTGHKLMRMAYGEERQQIGQIQKTLAAIQSAQSEEALRAAVSQIPGTPPTLGKITVPLAQGKELISKRLGGQIKRLENQLEENNALRWQKNLVGWARNCLIALCYGAGFAEIAHFPKARSSLLTSFLVSLPWNQKSRSRPRYDV